MSGLREEIKAAIPDISSLSIYPGMSKVLATRKGGEGLFSTYSDSSVKFSRVLLLLTPQRARCSSSLRALRSNLIQPPELRERFAACFSSPGYIDPFVSQQMRRILPLLLSRASREARRACGS